MNFQIFKYLIVYVFLFSGCFTTKAYFANITEGTITQVTIKPHIDESNVKIQQYFYRINNSPFGLGYPTELGDKLNIEVGDDYYKDELNSKEYFTNAKGKKIVVTYDKEKNEVYWEDLSVSKKIVKVNKKENVNKDKWR